ncbi:MAG TPA: hypothetical protein VGR40_09125 [Candidatus Binatus sp.]|nr:hypothetical protein [Candidatus Binatus sp.]
MAIAMMLALGAPAQAGSGASCHPKRGQTVDHLGSDGSECDASTFGKGSAANAQASGDKAFAEADAMTGGHAKATTTGVSSFSEASADSNSKSTATGKGDGSQTNASSDHNGKAASMTNGTNSEADTQAFGQCKSKATATGTNSLATASCSHAGTFAKATATNGGTAKAFDNMPPVCTPAGGTATVHSSGGDC